MTLELDKLDQLAASVFDGYVVRKDLVRKYSRQYPVPTYVVEFLLGRYCATVDEQEIQEGLQIVERQLQDRTVRTGHEEVFKHQARDHDDSAADLIHGLQLHGTAGELPRDERWERTLELYLERFPFVGSMPGTLERIRDGGQRLYRCVPSWGRWIDNRRGFGWKIELDLSRQS